MHGVRAHLLLTFLCYRANVKLSYKSKQKCHTKQKHQCQPNLTMSLKLQKGLVKHTKNFLLAFFSKRVNAGYGSEPQAANC